MKPQTILAFLAAFVVFHLLVNALFPALGCGGFDVKPETTEGVTERREQKCPPQVRCEGCVSCDDKIAAVREQYEALLEEERAKRGNSNPVGDSSGDVAVVDTPKKSSSKRSRANDGSVSPIGVVDVGGSQYLAVASVAQKMAGGKIMLPDDTTRVCVDVGTFLSSPSSKKWWQKDPKMFLVAIEANPFSYTMIKRMAHPTMVSKTTSYWPVYRPGSGAAKNHPGRNCNTSEVSYCIDHTWRHITRNYQRMMILNAAAKDETSFVQFNLGVEGQADTGSIFQFKQEKYRQAPKLGEVQVPLLRLDDVMKYVPLPTPPGSASAAREEGGTGKLLWDTLKIDAQGADAFVVHGTKHYLKHFLCIIGEFEDLAYKLPKGVEWVKTIMNEGFVKVDRRFFVNARYYEVFRSRDYLCSATDEVRKHDRIMEVLDTYRQEHGGGVGGL